MRVLPEADPSIQSLFSSPRAQLSQLSPPEASVLRHSAFFMVQLSHLYVMWKSQHFDCIMKYIPLHGSQPCCGKWTCRFHYLHTTVIRIEIKCSINVTCRSHPLTLACERTVFHETHPWCQKSWGPLKLRQGSALY